MVNATEFENKSKYVNAQKITEMPELQKTLTIVGVVAEEMRDGKKKLALCFDGTVQELVLNQTNLKTMIGAKGADTDKWRFTEVKLIVVPSLFEGKETKSVILNVV